MDAESHGDPLQEIHAREQAHNRESVDELNVDIRPK
jgi:hypothetical protein